MRAPKHQYTEEQRIFVRDNIKGRSRKEMQQMFNERFGTNLTVNQIVGFIKRNGFKSGRSGHFEKGKPAWNKGMKGLNIGGKETQFKKGQIPVNYRPIGSERINVEGYTEIKVADPGAWKLKHRVLWEKTHGKIPEGHAVIFGDGDKTNFNLDNLVLISRAELAMLNKGNLIKDDVELTKVGIIIANVQLKMYERIRSK